MILKLQVLALSLLFWMMAMSISYWMSPEEYAKQEWANPNLISELSDACKTAQDPKHCFWIWLSISKAESQMGNDPKARSHGYFWRVAWGDKSAYWFVKSYKKYYYIVNKYNEWWMFYGYWPKNPAPTSYCMSETSSNSVWHCPNGRASFNFIYSKYKQEVMEDNKQEVAKVELKRNVASKTPAVVAWSKRCKIIYTTPANGYIQADDYMGRFINRIRWLKKWSKVFFCWDVN